MPPFDFDFNVERRNSASLKWDLPEYKGLLPMWVADMDFVCPKEVLDGIKSRVDHGIFGYSLVPPSLEALVVERLQTRYGWQIDPAWLVWLPGLETALTLASQTIGTSGDEVLCFDPIYPPFYTGPRKAERHMHRLPLLKQGGEWVCDWEHLEALLERPALKLFLFCHPHNPVGKVFTMEELKRLGELCVANGVTICSDEVHCDLILDNRPHQPLATMGDAISDATMTFMAPSKTFNIAGLGCGFAVIPNAKLRQSFKLSMRSITPAVNPLAYAACESAYRHGEPWRLALLDYLKGNLCELMDFVASTKGKLSCIAPEATYLAWIDGSNLGVAEPYKFFKSHRLGFSPGSHFGDDQCVRINFACPRATLREAIARMEKALASLT